MWGIIPAAGAGTRIQPLAFSKELLPLGSRHDGTTERPRAVSEYLVERLQLAGVDRLCFIIAPGKSDILEYYGSGRLGDLEPVFVVQPRPAGLCDAVFRAVPLVADDEFVILGLPDTVWFPADALLSLGEAPLSFLLFPVDHPELFDAVVTAADGRVIEVQVKKADAATPWIWGAIKLRGSILRELWQLWNERQHQDEFIGTLINAWLARGGEARGIRGGERYLDVGTVHGYREALRLVGDSAPNPLAVPATSS